MRRIARGLLNAAAALCLVLFLVLSILLAASYQWAFYSREVRRSSQGRSLTIEERGYVVSRGEWIGHEDSKTCGFTDDADLPVVLANYPFFQGPAYERRSGWVSPWAVPPPQRFMYMPVAPGSPAQWPSGNGSGTGLSGSHRENLWAASLWLLVLPGFSAALAWADRRRARRLVAAGCCAACGYDLRGSAGACPECGAERLMFSA